MQKTNFNRIIISILIIFLVISSMNAAFAEELDANKTAVKTDCIHSNVTIEVNGTSKTNRTPLDVVLAIDSSNSMSWNDINGLRKTSAKNFINKLNETQDKVGVVNWDNLIRQQQPLTNNFSKAKYVVDQNSPAGNTNGALALKTSIAILDADTTLQRDQKFIILLTDGVFNFPNINPNQAALNQSYIAKNKGYKIFTIGLGYDINPLLLTEIANVTGGSYYFAKNASSLDPIYDQIYKTITKVASNITVTDVIPNYMTFESATINPTTNVLNSDGSRTLTWFIGDLSKDDSWKVDYKLTIDPDKKYGSNVPANVEAYIDYTDPDGNQGNVTLPAPLLNFDYSIIGGLVWDDVNGNGIMDNEEPRIKNVVVELFKSDISKGTKLTNDTGQYEFTELTPGNYYLKFNIPDEYFFTLKNQGFDDELDSDADPMTGLTTPFDLSCNITDTSWNAGIHVFSLNVTKSGNPLSVYAGEQLIYTINVKNNCTRVAHNVILMDTLPTELDNTEYSLNNVDWYSYVTGQSIGLGDIDVGQDVTLWIRGIVNPATLPGTISNTVYTSVNGTYTGNDTAINNVKSYADLSATKVGSHDPVVAGEVIDYVMTVTNNGPSYAYDVTFNDTLPDGLSNVNYSFDNVDWLPYINATIINLADSMSVGQTVTFYIRALVDADVLPGTNLTNVIVLNNTNGNGTFASNNTSVVSNAELVATKVGSPDPVVAGEVIDYVMTVTNNGPSYAYNVTFIDTLPDGLSNVNYSFNGDDWFTYNNSVVRLAGSMSVGETISFYIRALVDADVLPGSNLTNVIVLNNTNGNGTFASNNTSVFSNAELVATKVGSPDPVVAGEIIDYVMTVTNNGPSYAYNVTFIDSLPDGLSNANYSFDNVDWLPYTSGSIINLANNMSVGQTLTFYIRALVDADVLPDTVLTNVIVLNNSNGNGTNSTNKTKVISKADLSIEKTVDNSKPKLNSQVVFTIRAINKGPNTAVNVVVTDLLPDGLTFVSFTTNKGVYDPVSGEWLIGNLKYNEAVFLEITAIVNKLGKTANFANISSDTYDDNQSNNNDSVTIETIDDSVENKTIENATAKGIPMQKTGNPLIICFLVFFILLGGFFYDRK